MAPYTDLCLDTAYTLVYTHRIPTDKKTLEIIKYIILLKKTFIDC